MESRWAFLLGCVVSSAFIGVVAWFSHGDRELPRELTVERINIVEPDGTPRVIISNRARYPGSFLEGEEIARPDRTSFAGMLFINDEGTENGGLLQRGSVEADGHPAAAMSLTFDRFRQDQVLQLLQDEGDGGGRAAIVINDRPDYRQFSIQAVMALAERVGQLPPEDRQALIAKHRDDGDLGAQRAYFGTMPDGRALMILRDAKGRARLRFEVPAEGEPTIDVLDESGRVVRVLNPVDAAP